MKRLLLAVLLIAVTAAFGDDLVDAARAAKAKRKKSTTKVITNTDVKKAKARLAEHEPSDIAVEAAPTESSLEKQSRERLAETASGVRIAAARKILAEFEQELAAVEQQYYEENNLDRRDKELVRRFTDVKAKRDAAQKDLEALLPPPSDTEPSDPSPQQPNSSTAQ